MVITEAIFAQYGGHSGSATAAQLQSAFSISEQWMTEELHTFLVPTIVTATFAINPMSSTYVLPQGKIISINGVWFLDLGDTCDCAIVPLQGCGLIKNEEAGLVDVQRLSSLCSSCGGCCNLPYRVQIAYMAGLPTGTILHPNLLQGLVIGADIALEQIDLSDGDPGIKAWSSLRYSEQRNQTSLAMTAFGDTPRANFIRRLVKHWIVKRVGKVGW